MKSGVGKVRPNEILFYASKEADQGRKLKATPPFRLLGYRIREERTDRNCRMRGKTSPLFTGSFSFIQQGGGSSPFGEGGLSVFDLGS